MKAMILFVMSLSMAFAQDFQTARNEFAQRGASVQNALKAANTYKALAGNLAQELEKATAKVGEAEAMYYVGTHSSGDDAVQGAHERGFEAAKVAINLLKSQDGVAKKNEYKKMLARAYYFYSANLGKWGESRGVLRSLVRWPELKENTFFAKNLDESVEGYGPFRILGRGYSKVPSESDQKGFEFIEYGYKKSLTEIDGISISKNSTNVIYFLEIAKKVNKVKAFCDVFMAMEELVRLDDTKLLEYSTNAETGLNRLPETKDDIKLFNNSSDLQDFGRENC